MNRFQKNEEEALSLPSAETNKVVLHLVHGTWANGWRKSKRSWFNKGSQSYRRILEQLPSEVQIESFLWSGKNSMLARAEAASLFCDHLENCISTEPKTKHVILAHSHGGTVAADALKELNQRSTEFSQVAGIICLSTPFAYLINTSLAQFQTGLLAIVSLVCAGFWSCLLVLQPDVPKFFGSVGFIVVIGVVAMMTFYISLVLVYSVHKSMPDNLNVSELLPPVHLLRATRDEASLAIGLMQTFHWLSSVFARSHDISLVSKRPSSFVAYFMAYLLCSVLAVQVIRLLLSETGLILPDWAWAPLVVGVYAPAVAGAIYWLGYSFLAISVGHTQVRKWLFTRVEVDAAPPGVVCHLKIYSVLPAGGLRHGLYENEEVIKDLGTIFRGVIGK